MNENKIPQAWIGYDNFLKRITRWLLYKFNSNPRDFMFLLSRRFRTDFFIRKMPHEPGVKYVLDKMHGDLFVDVGANYGFYCFFLHRNFRKIIAVEPHPDNMREIRTTSMALGIRNIRYCQRAISTKNQKLPLFLSDDPGGHRLDKWKSGKFILVDSISLEKLLKSYEKVDLIKVDVEGSEWLVLESASNIMDRIKKWVIELHDLKRKTELETYMSAFSYQYEWLDFSHILAWKS